MEMTETESHLITHYGFDPIKKVLRVRFKNSGSTGEYFPFEEKDWADFQAAPSKGSHILKVLKKTKSYRRI